MSKGKFIRKDFSGEDTMFEDLKGIMKEYGFYELVPFMRFVLLQFIADHQNKKQ